jgi:hypothetical protein
MPTKPTDNVPEWASNANFSVGPTGIIGTPTRVATSLSTAVADGFVPWLPEAPATGQITNEWMHRGWALLDWVYQGSATASADAHIVETDADGRAALTSTSPGSPTIGTLTVTYDDSTPGTAIYAAAVQDGYAIQANTNDPSLPAIIAATSGTATGSVSVVATSAGDATAYRADVFDDARGFVASFDGAASPASRGFFCDLGAIEATAIDVRAGSNSGTGIYVVATAGSRAGIEGVATSGASQIVMLDHAGSGVALEINAAGNAAALDIDTSASTRDAGIDIFGNGSAGFAARVASSVSASNLSQQLDRSVVYVEAGDAGAGRGIALRASAFDAFSVSGIGVYGESNGLTAGSGGVYASGGVGEGHALICDPNSFRSSVRMQPTTINPLNGANGDLSVIEPSGAPLNNGMVYHDGVDWRRVAHTPRRTRDPAVGFENASSFTGAGTSSPLAAATFTAADGGDVLVCVDMGLSHTNVAACQISVESDDGSGGTVTTHLSLRNVRFATASNASTDSSRQWSWRRKITPTNTGPRRYYVTITLLGATTVYYWDVGLSVHGELAP